MKAVVQDTYGAADVLELRDVDKPVVGDDDVLLRVHAAGLNNGDGFVLRGLPYFLRLFGGLRRPRHGVRGAYVAGTVTGVCSSRNAPEAIRYLEQRHARGKVVITV